MAQKKTAAAKTARKTIKVPAPQAAPLLVAAEAAKVVEKPAANETTPQPRQAARVVEKPAAKKTTPQPRQAAKVVEKPAANETTPQPRQAAQAPSKGYGDLAAVGRDNLEACVKCGTIVAKGVETLGTEVMSFTQANIEADLAAARDIMAAKTLQEAIDLQTGFVQARVERMTSETAKLGELSVRLASLAMEPLRSRFDANTWANTWTGFRPSGR